MPWLAVNAVVPPLALVADGGASFNLCLTICPRAEWLRAVLVSSSSGAYSGVGFAEDAALTLIEVLMARKVLEAVQTVGAATYRLFLQPLVWMDYLELQDGFSRVV